MERVEEAVPAIALEETFRDEGVGGKVDRPAHAISGNRYRRRAIRECADNLNVPRLLDHAAVVLIVSAILYKTWYKRLEED